VGIRRRVAAGGAGRRVAVFREVLRMLVSEGGENYAVFTARVYRGAILRKGVEFFIQFSGRRGATRVLMDVPLARLCREEALRLREILMDYPSWSPVVVRDVEGCITSVSGYVDPSEAAEIAERIFREVFELPGNYSVEIEVGLG